MTTGLLGLAAMAVHLAAFALGAVMPVTMAQAAAEAAPGDIVICTIHGPLRINAASLGLAVPEDGSSVPASTDRQPCDVAQHAAAFAIAGLPSASSLAPAPVAPACITCPGSRAAHKPSAMARADLPRAPPVTV